MKVKVKKLDKVARLPTKATEGSSCYDVYSNEGGLSKTGVWLAPGEVKAFGTGLAFECDEGDELEVRPRSGLASKGILIANSPGTLDSDYRGELKVLLVNLSDTGKVLEKGDRIAQIKVNKCTPIEFEEVEELSETVRGKGGFGSTGI